MVLISEIISFNFYPGLKYVCLVAQDALEVMGVSHLGCLLMVRVQWTPAPVLKMCALAPEQRVFPSSTVHIVSCLKTISALPPRQDFPSASFYPLPSDQAAPSLSDLNPG